LLSPRQTLNRFITHNVNGAASGQPQKNNTHCCGTRHELVTH
jgi:hypothetical protein